VPGFTDHQLAEIRGSGALEPPRKRPNKPPCPWNTNAAGLRGHFCSGMVESFVWNAVSLIFVALQTIQCCYANKVVVSGIWYT